MATIDRRGVSVDATDTAIVGNPNPGLAWKAPVLVATTANITLSGLQTIDGVALAEGNRVLVWQQTDAKTNGIYNASTGAWTRAIDLSSNDEIADALQVAVARGTAWGGINFSLATADPITIGTTEMAFVIRPLYGVVKLLDGSAAAPSLAFASDTDTGLYRVGASIIGVAAGGLASLAVSATAITGPPASNFNLRAASGRVITFGAADSEPLLVADGGSAVLYPNPNRSWSLGGDGIRFTNMFSGAIDVKALNAVGTTTAQTATVGKFFDGSAAHPHTANTPSFSFSRYEAQSSDTLTGNAPTVWVSVDATNTGSGNPNANAILGEAIQRGKGDLVGVVGRAELTAASTSGHTAYGLFGNAIARVAGSRAFSLELTTQNFSGADVAYTNLTPYPSFVGANIQASGDNLNTTALWINGTAPSNWDVGLAFTTGSVKTTAIQDDSTSVTILKTTTAHTHGIDLNSGSFLTSAFRSPGFAVDGSGSITLQRVAGANITLTGGTAFAHSAFLSVGNSGLLLGPTTADPINFLTTNIIRGSVAASAADWSFGTSGNQGTLSLFGSSSGSAKLIPPSTGGGNVTLFAGSDTVVGRATTDTLTNKSIDASSNTISNLTTAMFAVNVVDNDSALTANSSTRLPTQAAVKAYADALIAANDAMVFKGVIDCSSNPNYPAADRGHTYKVSVAGKIGGASGVTVEVGDTLLCITDGTASGNQATVGAAWNIVQANLVGAVTGPASSTSGNVATFNGTGGTVIQDSGKALPAGSIVGTSDTQTLTGKTISGASNTLSNIAIGSLTGLGTGVATALAAGVTGTGNIVLAASPTMTGTLTVPTVNATSQLTAASFSITGNGSFGAGGTANATNNIIFNGPSGTGGGFLLYLQKNGSTNWSLSHQSAVAGSGTSSDLYLANYGGGAFAALVMSAADSRATFGSTVSGTATNAAAIVANSLGLAENAFIGGSLNLAGVATLASGTATPAGGSTAARLLLGTTAGFGIYYGSGAPTVSAAQGSLYIRSDGSSTTTRLYVNTNGSTGWTNFASAA